MSSGEDNLIKFWSFAENNIIENLEDLTVNLDKSSYGFCKIKDTSCFAVGEGNNVVIFDANKPNFKSELIGH